MLSAKVGRLALLLVICLLVAACGGQTIQGSFTLTDDDIAYSGASCSGQGGYSDIRAGTAVVIRDEAGKILATSALVVDPAGSSASRCRYTFSASVDVAEFYEIEVSKRGGLTYSFDQMIASDWTISATLGN